MELALAFSVFEAKNNRQPEKPYFKKHEQQTENTMIEFLIYASGVVLLGVAFLLATTELFDPVIVAVARLLGHEVEVRSLYDAWSESRFTTIDQEPVKNSIAATPTRHPRKPIKIVKTCEARICRRCGGQLIPGEEHSHD